MQAMINAKLITEGFELVNAIQQAISDSAARKYQETGEDLGYIIKFVFFLPKDEWRSDDDWNGLYFLKGYLKPLGNNVTWKSMEDHIGGEGRYAYQPVEAALDSAQSLNRSLNRSEVVSVLNQVAKGTRNSITRLN